jgi:hypothetical protein
LNETTKWKDYVASGTMFNMDDVLKKKKGDMF